MPWCGRCGCLLSWCAFAPRCGCPAYIQNQLACASPRPPAGRPHGPHSHRRDRSAAPNLSLRGCSTRLDGAPKLLPAESTPFSNSRPGSAVSTRRRPTSGCAARCRIPHPRHRGRPARTGHRAPRGVRRGMAGHGPQASSSALAGKGPRHTLGSHGTAATVGSVAWHADPTHVSGPERRGADWPCLAVAGGPFPVPARGGTSPHVPPPLLPVIDGMVAGAQRLDEEHGSAAADFVADQFARQGDEKLQRRGARVLAGVELCGC